MSAVPSIGEETLEIIKAWEEVGLEKVSERGVLQRFNDFLRWNNVNIKTAMTDDRARLLFVAMMKEKNLSAVTYSNVLEILSSNHYGADPSINEEKLRGKAIRAAIKSEKMGAEPRYREKADADIEILKKIVRDGIA